MIAALCANLSLTIPPNPPYTSSQHGKHGHGSHLIPKSFLSKQFINDTRRWESDCSLPGNLHYISVEEHTRLHAYMALLFPHHFLVAAACLLCHKKYEEEVSVS